MTDSLSIPEINLEFYRGDTAVKNILLSTTVGTITATAGSATVTVSDSDELAVGYNLYDTNGVLIGTVATVAPSARTMWLRSVANFPSRLANATLATLTT